MTVTIRQLDVADLTAVCDIDMREDGDIVYKVVDKQLQAVPEEWHRPPRTRQAWDRHIANWRAIFERGGAAWGAFDRGRMVGVIVLRHHLTEDMAELAALFVSRSHRRTGVARRLVEKLIPAAREAGACRLYVSATPSRSAVGFYQSQGFQLAETVHPELYALEPEDIHMVRSL